eukprot:10206065-Alexandrium_andersonii.AAC.1
MPLGHSGGLAAPSVLPGLRWPWPSRVPAVVASKAELGGEHDAWAEEVARRWQRCSLEPGPLANPLLEDRTEAGHSFRQDWWLGWSRRAEHALEQALQPQPE